MDEFNDLEQSLRWYRNLSDLQIGACNDLLHALRDDICEETAYRVHDCLDMLGLHPLPSSKQLKTIIEISQGNDLAFLWFLWEAYYKDQNSSKPIGQAYNSNEQFILTGIAHLDMAMTKRGLDKVLPLPENGKRFQQHLQQKLPKQEQKQQRQRQYRPKEPASKLPYFIPQVRPKSVLPPARISKLDERKCSFKDKDIPNESSRWFATYELSPMKREVKKCLTDAIAQIFVREHRSTDKSLCGMHRMMERNMINTKHELTTDTLQRCMQLLDIGSLGKCQQSAGIVRQLEREVLQAAKKWEAHRMHHLMEMRSKYIRNSHPCKEHCQMCVKLVSMPDMVSQQDAKDGHIVLPLLVTTDSQTNPILGHPMPYQDDLQSVHVMQLGRVVDHKTISLLPDPSLRCPGPAKKTNVKPVKVKTHVNKPLSKSSEKPVKVKKTILNKPLPKSSEEEKPVKVIKDPPSDVPSTGSLSTEADNQCFRRFIPNGMLAWNFFRIYGAPEQHSEPDLMYADPQPIIRSYCVAALQKAMEAGKKKQTSKKHMERIQWQQRHVSDVALETADTSVRQTFRAGQQNALVEAAEPDNSQSPKRLQVNNIDPENRQMLCDLLNSAMDILRKDARYVLVTLPNAHKMPPLLEWVAQRYGRTFRDHRAADTLVKTHKVLKMLRLNTSLAHFPEPKYNDFQWPPEATCSAETILSRFRQMRNEYYSRLNEMDLQDSRLIWLALRSYSRWSNLSKKTFFAYMPSKKKDFNRQNLCLSCDYRHVVSLRKGVVHK